MAVGATMSAIALSVTGTAVSSLASADQPMTATTWVNMRSGPGTTFGVLDVVSPNQTVLSTGTVQGGWYEVSADGATGWIYQSYLRSTAAPPPAPAPPSTPTAPSGDATAPGTAVATTSVNIRSGPGTSYAVVGVLARGASIATTGGASGSWAEVVHNGAKRWIHSAYLTAGSGSATPTDEGSTPPPAPSTPVATGQVRSTANVYLRTSGTITAPQTGVLPANSIVDTTGRTTADYTEIIHQGQARWIATVYTAAVSIAPTAPSVPTATGTVYVNVGVLNVRATSAADGAVVAQVYRGDALSSTGVTENNRTQIIHQGAARWVYTPYVSATKPAEVARTLVTSGISQLTPSARKVYDHVAANYPRISTIYGWRASSNWSSDHPNGRAVDIMLPTPWSNAANADYGWEIARYFQANAKAFNISYIIYRQSTWNAAYPDRGWKPMEDRGSVTENHYDHVHVSVKS